MFSTLCSWSESSAFLRLPHSYEEPPATEGPLLWVKPYHLRHMLLILLTKLCYFCGGFCTIAIPYFFGHLSLLGKSLSAWPLLFTAHSKWLQEIHNTTEHKDNFRHEMLNSLCWFCKVLLGHLWYTNYVSLIFEIAVEFLNALEPASNLLITLTQYKLCRNSLQSG